MEFLKKLFGEKDPNKVSHKADEKRLQDLRSRKESLTPEEEQELLELESDFGYGG